MADNASEQTLQDLLDQARAMNASLQKIASLFGKAPKGAATGATGGGKSGADEALSKVTAQASKFLPVITATSKAFSGLLIAVDLIAKIFSGLGGLLSSLFDRVGAVAGILGEFAGKAAQGNMKLSEMVDVMGQLANQIPLVGGALGGLIGIMKFVIERQEESLAMFRKMSSVGAGVGESLETLRQNARSTGLTMDEYAGAVQKNSAVFATMGGDVQAGVKQFNKNMQAVMGPGSEVSKSFFGMGYTAEEAAGALANYMKSQGSINKQGLNDSKATAAAALQLAQQTQALSETTGKRREQVQAELDEAQEEANWKAYLAGLTEKGALEATQKLSYALQHGGKDVSKMVQTGMMTGVVLPLTESAQSSAAITGGATVKFAEDIVKASGSAEEMQVSFDKANTGLVKGTAQAVKDVGQVSALQVGMGQKGLLDAQLIANQNRALQNGKLKSDEEQLKDAAAQRAKIKAAGNTDAASLSQQTQNLRTFGNVIDGMIGTLAGPFLKPILEMTGAFQDIALKVVNWIQPYITQFSAWLKPWVEEFSKIAKTGTFDEFMKAIGKMWGEAWAYMKPKIQEVWDAVKPVLFDAIKNLFGFLWDAIKESIIPRWMRSDTDSEKAADRANSPRGKAAAATEARNAAATSAPPSSNPASRDLAKSVLAGEKQDSDVPPELKSQVDTWKKDTQLQQAAAKQKAAQEAADAKQASELANQANQPKPAAAASASQNSSADVVVSLNNNIERLIRANVETAENTKAMASKMSGSGNLYK